MKKNINKNKLESLIAIAEYVTSKNIINKKDALDIKRRLDDVLSSFNREKKFFKRLNS